MPARAPGAVSGPGDVYDATGSAAVVGANIPVNAASGNVLTSDANGNLSLQPPAQSPSAAYLLRAFAV